MESQTKPPVQSALDELHNDVTSPEELATLKEWQKEIDAERADALKFSGGAAVHELVQLPDGTIETKDHIEAERAAGHDVVDHNTAGRQS